MKPPARASAVKPTASSNKTAAAIERQQNTFKAQAKRIAALERQNTELRRQVEASKVPVYDEDYNVVGSAMPTELPAAKRARTAARRAGGNSSSALRALADTVKVKEEQRDRIEHLDMLVSPLTLQGQEGKTLLKDAKNALLDAGVPSRLKPDRYVPWYYGEASYTSQEKIPWNVEAKRALTPAEGVAWLASERDGLAQQQGELRSRLEAAAAALEAG